MRIVSAVYLERWAILIVVYHAIDEIDTANNVRGIGPIT